MNYILLPFLLCSAVLFGQDTVKVEVEESGSKQIRAVRSADFHSSESVLKVKGDFDTQFAHPDCSEPEGDEQEGCTTKALIEAIKNNLNYNPEEGNKPVEKDKAVDISFSINQYGNVKSIRVDYTGDPRISQSIIQALYAVPRMIPAHKDGKAVPSSCELSLPYETLFGS